MSYKQDDFESVIAMFQDINSPLNRYASFDYCYKYFQESSKDDLLADIEKSCLVIGFYLASWGMLRGSSFLLNKSLKYYEPLVLYIANLDKKIWEIDVDSYTDENIKIICDIYHDIQILIIDDNNAHLTLVTKIMLGVFGFVPAFDRYFTDAFRAIFKGKSAFRSLNAKSLKCIHEFYIDNKSEIDKTSQNTFVIDFKSGITTSINYKKAKIIDMYGVMKGG